MKEMRSVINGKEHIALMPETPEEERMLDKQLKGEARKCESLADAAARLAGHNPLS